MNTDKIKDRRSSFLSVEKDMEQIVHYLMKNDRLKKLLYWDTKDCLSKPSLNEEQAMSVIKNRIKLVPYFKFDDAQLSYIRLAFDAFVPNPTNPAFRDNLITIDVFCHPSIWNLYNFELRPFKIMGEIDAELDRARLHGIGELEFVGANELILNADLCGYTMAYRAIHSKNEDRMDELVTYVN